MLAQVHRSSTDRPQSLLLVPMVSAVIFLAVVGLAGACDATTKEIAPGVCMPLVSLGHPDDGTKEDQSAVLWLSLGARGIDTAFSYHNQNLVGKAVRASGVPREELFVTTKVPCKATAEESLAAVREDLKELQMDYVDLMLIHFPASWTGVGGAALRKEEWLALEKWAKTGKARAIGVSHYCKTHIEDILSVATLPIALNQVMYHVGMGMSPDLGNDWKNYCQSKGIVYMSFSTLCGPCEGNDKMELINGPLVTKLGKAHNKTGPQIALRWAVQQGIPVVPKSGSPKHLKEDFDLFSFSLTPAEMGELTSATTPATGRDDSGDCEIKSEMKFVVV